MGIESHKDTVEEKKPKISNESFDEQFMKQSAEVDGNSIEFTKVEPEEGETISDQWVVFLGGFGAGVEEYRAEIRDVVDSGRKVFFLNPIKGIEMTQENSEALEDFNIPETIKNKAAEILQALDTAKINRADFIGHSQGAILGAVVASLRPGIADDLVLNNPGGMHGEDTRRAMVGRTVAGLAEQQMVNTKRAVTESGEGARIGSVIKSVLKGAEIHKNPVYRTTQEVPGIVNSDIVSILREIKRNKESSNEDQNTTIKLVTSNKDRTFSPSRIEEQIGFNTESVEDMNTALEDVVDSYSMYISKDAGHESLIYEKTGLTAQLVNEKFMKNKTKEDASDLDANDIKLAA